MLKRAMRSRRIVIIAAALLILPGVVHSATIDSVKANNTTIGRYARYEMTFDLKSVSPSNYNPFRPETTSDSLSQPGVDVWAQIVTPSGKTVKVYGFWDVDFEYLGQIGSYGEGWDRFDKFVPASSPHWKVRYAPMELGAHKVRVFAKDQSGTASTGEYTFTCVDTGLKGFIKLSDDKRRLVHSNGDPFIPIGSSIKDHTILQNTYMPKLAENGMNFVRRWLVNGDYGDIFRVGFPQTWRLFGTSYDSSARSGKRSVKKSVTGSGTFIEEQFVPVRGSSRYRAGVWLRASSDFNGAAAVVARVYYTDGSRASFTGNSIRAGANWTKSAVDFNTSSGSKVVDFIDYRVDILSGSSGTVWADDAELYEIDGSGNIKVNYNYLWQPSFEDWNPSQLRLWALWRFERLLSLGEHYGIAAQACIFDYRLWNTVSPTGFYTNYLDDFWTGSSSIAQQERALRHLVARFSAYTSLFAWELTNEMDPSYTDIRRDWIAGRANYIKSIDPHRHPVTNSYWTSPGDMRFAQMPELDLNQVHYYINTEERKGGQGVPTWWGQPSGAVIDRNSSNARSGTSSLKFTANGGTIAEGQSVYLKPNRSYTFRYWVKMQGVSGKVSAYLRYYSPENKEITSATIISTTGSSSYTAKQHTFTTASNCARVGISLEMSGSSGTAWIDDVEVIDNSTGKDVFYNGGFESPNFGDDEFEWAVYFTYLTNAICGAGPNPTEKPWISGEFGLMGFNAHLSGWADPTSSNPRRDTTGIHIHNCVWAQFMAGSAAHTPSYWWINEYIMHYDLAHVWKGMTTFASKLPFYERGESISTAPYPAEVRAVSSNPNVRALGQFRSNKAYMWIQNRGYSWSKVVREGVNPSPASAEISILGFSNGEYVVDWYDTHDGRVTRTETRSATSGTLKLSVSSLSKDAAVMVRPSGVTATPNLTLNMSADKLNVLPGDTLTYTITYRNTGSAEAKNATITAPVPQYTTYVSGGSYNSGSSTVSWSLSSVAPGAIGTVVYRVKVD